ncbi:AraC family transcriptional regulator [Shouchella clausii]|uniref:AraC family transcriptional regulator n=1 Tax=Shouchella clausii TaxID=79880 RepID=UPI002710742D|nr:AraC family transcriptional regulator [Shouchella clausii]MDO7269689.1 AraC family transcriptional regulator [Shouchella clausii]MDO7289685.1 AraC family transcriptional regulator [Shouchella clausii]
MSKTSENVSYGFRFQEQPYPFVMNLWNVGWETQTDQAYRWDGTKRMEREKIVFQYTLSGYGELVHEGTLYKVEAGQAFFVSLPSAHCYYYPEEETEPWEFLYVTIEGKEALRMQKHMENKYGPVFSLQKDSEPIRRLFKLYAETAAGEIQDSYTGSQKAYEFILSCFRFLEVPPKQVVKEPLARAIRYIEANYARPLTLEEIAQEAGWSKYYFIKQFKTELNITPMNYVTIIRIKKAASLLAQTDDTIAEVAYQVGMVDPNYFTKVFKKTVGVSASKFRKNEDNHLIDYIVTEW